MKRINSNIIMCGIAAMMVATTMGSCDKVSPLGVLDSGTGVNDRVEMSVSYYKRYLQDSVQLKAPGNGDYSFLVGSDSHVTEDGGRMIEMIDSGIEHGDLLWAHLGDIADTKAEYYIALEKALKSGKLDYITKYFESAYTDLGDIYWYDNRYPHGDDDPEYDNFYTASQILADSYRPLPFFPVVGNHDLTHNGWALFSSMFGSSFYEIDVEVGNLGVYDHFIFLDTANGTLGDKQIEYIEDGLMKSDKVVRHTFVFSHTNIFRPSSTQFASTFPREEMYYLLNKFDEWDCRIVFCGHVHKWDDRMVGNVRYVTLESMSERNSPEPGDYLVRVTCKANGDIETERVHMSYTAKK